MTFGDMIGYEDPGELCIVCGKGLRSNEAIVKFHHDGQTLPICCPLCMEMYQKDPKPFLERFAKRAQLRELRRSEQK